MKSDFFFLVPSISLPTLVLLARNQQRRRKESRPSMCSAGSSSSRACLWLPTAVLKCPKCPQVTVLHGSATKVQPGTSPARHLARQAAAIHYSYRCSCSPAAPSVLRPCSWSSCSEDHWPRSRRSVVCLRKRFLPVQHFTHLMLPSPPVAPQWSVLHEGLQLSKSVPSGANWHNIKHLCREGLIMSIGTVTLLLP